jgi:subtilase family serine protease
VAGLAGRYGDSEVTSQSKTERMRVRGLAALVAIATIGALLSSVGNGAAYAAPLPTPQPNEITYYLSLPTNAAGLDAAANAVSTPGSTRYRHFSTLVNAGDQFGASDAQIARVSASVQKLGLQFAPDPTRLFGRVTGTTRQWATALGTPLSVTAATASSPFTTYTLPEQVPAALEPAGTGLLLPQAQVYDPAADQGRGAMPNAPPPTKGAKPFPFNTGQPVSANCVAAPLQQRRVYTPQQIQTAYGVDALRRSASGTPVITIVDLGDGWRRSDLALAGECFGYTPPEVTQEQGDGVAAPINSPGTETPLDVQTVAAVMPNAQVRVVQTTPADLLDGFSRAVGDPRGLPDVISLSFGGCAFAENRGEPLYTGVINAVLAMVALTGVSSFAASGDAGSTTCGKLVDGTSLSYPAVSPFVTAVGGTRLTLGPGNNRVAETTWNDSVFGAAAASGGGLTRLQPRPAYQDGANPANHRAVPDISALADIVPGWPVVVSAGLQTVGGTSGSTPFVAAATALIDATQRQHGQPRIGLANGWLYQAAKRPSTFFDVTTGNNDLAHVGCCHATAGYDPVTGLGVPNWAVLPGTLPPPG